MNGCALHFVRLLPTGLGGEGMRHEHHAVCHVDQGPELNPRRQRRPAFLQRLDGAPGVIGIAPLDADHLPDQTARNVNDHPPYASSPSPDIRGSHAHTATRTPDTGISMGAVPSGTSARASRGSCRPPDPLLWEHEHPQAPGERVSDQHVDLDGALLNDLRAARALDLVLRPFHVLHRAPTPDVAIILKLHLVPLEEAVTVDHGRHTF